MILNLFNIGDVDIVVTGKCVNIRRHVMNSIVLDVAPGLYKIRIYYKGRFVDQIVAMNCPNKPINYYYKGNLKKFILNDYYYPNLKIERGVLILWPTTSL